MKRYTIREKPMSGEKRTLKLIWIKKYYKVEDLTFVEDFHFQTHNIWCLHEISYDIPGEYPKIIKSDHIVDQN